MRPESPESLLHIPLVAQMLDDPHVRLVARAIDRDWRYSGRLPVSVIGFAPHDSAVYYGARSLTADWLRDPVGSARALNASARAGGPGDQLVREVLLSAHDYLHCWAYLAVQNLKPQLGFATRPVTASNFEDFVFCHLLTETVATVGLDYWYLCSLDLNSVCPIGTRVEGVTTPYHERNADEIRRFNPAFDAQSRSFFDELAQFYCTGSLPGFRLESLRQSPIVAHWLGHEMACTLSQRRYARLWMAHLSRGAVRPTPDELSAPVRADKPWQRELTQALGDLLWRMVKRGERTFFGPVATAGNPWARAADDASGDRLDFRFLNANRHATLDLSGRFDHAEGPASFEFYVYQFLSAHEHAAFETEIPALESALDDILRDRDWRRLQSLFDGVTRVTTPTAEAEPASLFILN